uniref:CRM domain-containing protein n=1 Tax=Vitis vinifera TaxID=29760 RepID=F6HSR3_VITVI
MNLPWSNSTCLCAGIWIERGRFLRSRPEAWLFGVRKTLLLFIGDPIISQLQNIFKRCDSSPTGIFMEEMVDSQPVNGSLYEREADRLLDGLGPRFIDWWRPKPLPVDADLLPEVLPGFRPPFRLSPPQTRSKLTDDELTYLRKLAYALPTHFVLGRNRKLQGLAAAILKLWEKSLIVKIAIKWGIPNTKNEQMANELKCLTGGVLLLRNKFFIILYRGKDFLPCRVANLIVEREMEFKGCQIREEDARLKAIETSFVTDKPLANTSTTGTLSEFQNIETEFRGLKDGNTEIEVELEAEKERLEKELKKQERNLFILKRKIERSAKVLAKLNSAWRPADHDADKEMITEEERECFRKIGQKMDSSLLLGKEKVHFPNRSVSLLQTFVLDIQTFEVTGLADFK